MLRRTIFCVALQGSAQLSCDVRLPQAPFEDVLCCGVQRAVVWITPPAKHREVPPGQVMLG